MRAPKAGLNPYNPESFSGFHNCYSYVNSQLRSILNSLSDKELDDYMIKVISQLSQAESDYKEAQKMKTQAIRHRQSTEAMVEGIPPVSASFLMRHESKPAKSFFCRVCKYQDEAC